MRSSKIVVSLGGSIAMVLVAATLGCGRMMAVEAFVSSSMKHSRVITQSANSIVGIPAFGTRQSRLALMPDQSIVDVLAGVDSESVTSSAQMLLSQHHQDFGLLLSNAAASSSHWLADANAAAASATAETTTATGWWGNYLNVFKNALSFVHSVLDQPLRGVGITQTWGVSIAVFTCLIRTLLIPLSIQQSQSAEYMKALRPYMNEIRSKYEKSPDTMNRAMAQLMADAQQNPLAGCLLSLAQLPVFLGLYRGVRLLAIEGQLEEPFLWIPTLEGPVSAPDYRGLDWLIKGWTTGDGILPSPSLGWETTLAFLIMPAVLVVMQSLTMQVLQPPIDPDMGAEEKQTMERSQAIFKFLPLLIGFFSLQVPAGLTIYWFSSNLFTLSQSLAVRAYFAANPPKIELPEYWDTALSKDTDFNSMTPEERRQAAKAGINIGPSMQDLIDEAQFHCLIERQSFREETEAWQRLMASTASTAMEDEQGANGASVIDMDSLPEDLRKWVDAKPTVSQAGAVAK